MIQEKGYEVCCVEQKWGPFLSNSSKILLQKSLHFIMFLINSVSLMFSPNSLLLITVYLLTVAATAIDLNIAPCLSIVTLNY